MTMQHLRPPDPSTAHPAESPGREVTSLHVGARYLGPSGRTWTITWITANHDRVVLVSAEADGDHGMVVDPDALRRMIPLDGVASRLSTGP